ncbi:MULTISPECIES: hypothetical protein [unclassified Parafrankia]|uniref:hypothetical protein n=1 Tax=unclassified Parafrankia TaxID=2994368 RepID=UPI000DA5833B|nr:MULTISPECIES: hypothetical protein [unclassified Parafrankia]TCJ35027.1 hypothetical protein E0504_30240 [Parafrankia sp. BMG5.11]SQD97329.1 conserved hypothetical protein [Parafrankia sp. Ea1.12]
MLYRIIQRRHTGGTYGPWQPVTDTLLVSLDPAENEIEFSADDRRLDTDQATPCDCNLFPSDHRHRVGASPTGIRGPRPADD